MKIWKAVLNFVDEFANLDSEDYAELSEKIKEDYEKIRFDDEFFRSSPDKVTWKNKVKKFFEDPWIMLLTAVCYIFAFRWTKHWVLTAGILTPEEEEILAQREEEGAMPSRRGVTGGRKSAFNDH